MFSKAIVCQPAANFADGLSTAELGVPDFAKTIVQHQAYCDALSRCGLKLTQLPADPKHPDSTFVEDTAIVTAHGAILTRPGTESRAGEVGNIKLSLSSFYSELPEIRTPGTLDGGDICEAGNHFIIGISLRTNENGAKQLADWLASQGYTSDFVDIRSVPSILHLKSGISYIGDKRMVVINSLANHPALKDFELIRTQANEDYAANCVRVNDYVLMASGFPILQNTLEKLGYSIIALDMSEYQKMDGGLSCLSIRF
jgi:dimethylargininase